MQIKSLEEELGVKLLDRLGKNVMLTDAGQQFLPYATKILNDVEEAKCVSSQHWETTGTCLTKPVYGTTDQWFHTRAFFIFSCCYEIQIKNELQRLILSHFLLEMFAIPLRIQTEVE